MSVTGIPPITDLYSNPEKPPYSTPPPTVEEDSLSTSFYFGTGGVLQNTAATRRGLQKKLYAYYIDNSLNAVTAYVAFFDSLSPVLGSATPLFVLGVPAGLGANMSFRKPVRFQFGLTFAVVSSPLGSAALASAVE